MLDARSVQIFASLSSSSVMRRPITRNASAVIFRTIFSSFVLSGPNAHPRWANCFRHSSWQKRCGGFALGFVTGKRALQFAQRRFFNFGGFRTVSSFLACSLFSRRLAGDSGTGSRVPKFRWRVPICRWRVSVFGLRCFRWRSRRVLFKVFVLLRDSEP